jgi:hypothetical protein
LLLVGWVVDGDHGEEYAGGGVGYGGDECLPLATSQQTKVGDSRWGERTPNAASHPTIYERNFEYDLGANSETQSVLVGVSLTVFDAAGRYQLWLD